MPRPSGSRNRDFGGSRDRIVELVAGRLCADDGASVSFREMAEAAGVSPATLRHYFTDRAGVLRAVFERVHLMGEPYLREVAAGVLTPFPVSVRWLLSFVVVPLREQLARLLVVGTANGPSAPEVARACLAEFLEPTIQAVELRLQRHVGAGEMRDVPVRGAALALLAPVIVAVLHQDELDGRTYRPLDLEAFLDAHAEGFVRGYGAGGG